MTICLASCGSKSSSDVSDADSTTIDSVSTETEQVVEDDYESTLAETESEDEAEANAEVDSEDWDAILNTYEEYVDDYVKLMKKASKGDMTALAGYASFLEKAQDLSDKIENSKQEMSASQMERYLKITSKMATAMQDI